MNPLVRGYFPKGADLLEVTDADVDVDRLNRCPRKVLGHRTPAKVSHKAHPPWGRPPLSVNATIGFPTRVRQGSGRSYALALPRRTHAPPTGP